MIFNEVIGNINKIDNLNKYHIETINLNSEDMLKSEIDMFRRSKLFLEMLNAKKVWRELRFNVLLPASEFTEDEEKIKAFCSALH